MIHKDTIKNVQQFTAHRQHLKRVQPLSGQKTTVQTHSIIHEYPQYTHKNVKTIFFIYTHKYFKLASHIV